VSPPGRRVLVLTEHEPSAGRWPVTLPRIQPQGKRAREMKERGLAASVENQGLFLCSSNDWVRIAG
jgi:hypothetical protein